MFTKEIDRALLDGRCDLGVHQQPDRPADPAPMFDKVSFSMHPAPGEVFSGRHLLASVDGMWSAIVDSDYLPSAEVLSYNCERRNRFRSPQRHTAT